VGSGARPSPAPSSASFSQGSATTVNTKPGSFLGGAPGSMAAPPEGAFAAIAEAGSPQVRDSWHAGSVKASIMIPKLLLHLF